MSTRCFRKTAITGGTANNKAESVTPSTAPHIVYGCCPAIMAASSITWAILKELVVNRITRFSGSFKSRQAFILWSAPPRVSRRSIDCRHCHRPCHRGPHPGSRHSHEAKPTDNHSPTSWHRRSICLPIASSSISSLTSPPGNAPRLPRLSSWRKLGWCRAPPVTTI